MEAESSVRFGLDVSASSVRSGSGTQVIPAAGMIHPGLGSLLSGVGMSTAAGFVLPAGALTSAGYGAVPSVPHAAFHQVAMAAGLAPEGGGNGERPPPPPQKGPWTAEEDDILKDMVREHGDRKWAVIARFLPGRIGKQCRERWTNHLRPDILKSIWTEEDDKALIEAHKSHGNRWSVIARYLPGRSENAVKNHWNTTRRSINAKRRLKKNGQAAPDEWSILEEYIRSLYPAATDLAVPLQPAVSPASYNLEYGDLVGPPAAAASPLTSSQLTGFGTYGNPVNSSHLGTVNVNAPLLLNHNAYHGELPQAMTTAQPWMIAQDLQAPYTNLTTYPFVDNFVWPSSSVQTNGSHCYYCSDPAGPSSGAGPNNVDVVQMASTEFLTPSEDEITLDLARFM
ncbi:uncharacterized protein LOC133910689 [Phragmites australis]|uniref:uncharacterized protein LOC133910689 n=1 Tax=Phragmites australis TaxID=29695 RepID=UPI002D7996D6|nr:uncharacterized protein LOC133910689 [Phragmites australis]